MDMITAPGPSKILADAQDKETINHIRRCIEISVNKHKSNLVAVVGHYDCAGNPNPKDIQLGRIEGIC